MTPAGSATEHQADAHAVNLRPLARVAAAFALLLGLVVLVGWATDIATLKSVMPHLVSMKPNTAVALVLGAAALWLSVADRRPHGWQQRVAAGCAVALGAIGSLTSIEHLLARDLGIDQLLWSEPLDAIGTSAPGRTSLNAAIAFTLLALALLAKRSTARRIQMLGDAAAIAAFLIPFLAFVGYLYGVTALTGFPPYTLMAVHSAAGIIALALGILVSRHPGPIADSIASSGPGGLLLRRFLPASVVIVLVVGHLRLLGEIHGLYGLRQGLAIMVVTSIILFTVGIAFTARVLDRAESHRKRLEHALLENEERYHIIVDAMFDGVAISEDGVIRDANEGLALMLGYELHELHSMRVLDLVSDESPDRVVDSIRSGTEGIHEVVGRRRDGERIHLEVIVKADRAHDRNVCIAAFRDVTQRRKLEKQFRQAMKLEAVGRLAGGVAHDFNNLLTVISGHAEMIAGNATEPSTREDVRQILDASASAAALTKQLLAFSRQQAMAPIVLSLNASVTKAGTFLRRLLGEHISVRTDLAKDLRSVKADPVQLEQIILNLAFNARDAMPYGGTLTLETSNADLDVAYTSDLISAGPGGYVVLAVSDTGLGMDAKTQRRIFEPYFTTKELGRGTGLGLATVYGIVKQNGGFISVSSEPGHGTTFKIYLPSCDQPMDAERPAMQQPA